MDNGELYDESGACPNCQKRIDKINPQTNEQEIKNEVFASMGPNYDTCPHCNEEFGVEEYTHTLVEGSKGNGGQVVHLYVTFKLK
jgi:hypothetical protein